MNLVFIIDKLQMSVASTSVTTPVTHHDSNSSSSSSTPVVSGHETVIDMMTIWHHIPTIDQWLKAYDHNSNFIGFWSGNKDTTYSYLCNFVEANHPAGYSERDFMLGKAEYFNDMDTHAKILVAKTPKEIKDLGRLVKGFHPQKVGDKEGWDVACLYYMYVACMNKFTHPNNVQLLLDLWSTQPFPLAETSPFDATWGIKLSISDTKRVSPTKYGKNLIWKGQNLLGRTLMLVRDVTWAHRHKYVTVQQLWTAKLMS
jgi:ribA/ribD-fused uncharacterized protein